MTTAAKTAARPALLAGLAERIPLAGPSWLPALRRAAADRLLTEGFPTRKTEAWRFTSVVPITDVDFRPPRADQDGGDDWPGWVAARLGDDDDAFRVIVVNGRPLPAEAPPSGVEVVPLASALADSGPAAAVLESTLGRIARTEHFAALNAALFEDGLLVRFGEGAVVDRPIHIVHVAVAPAGAPVAAYPRVCLVAGAGSEAQVIESYLAAPGAADHLTACVTEVEVGDNARLEHVRVHERDEVGGEGRAFHVGALGVRQQRSSRYASRVVTLGGALFRLDVDVVMEGEGAECRLDGVYHARGRDHVDHHTRIDHAVPHCTSHEDYRGLLDGAARAVFDGTIVVRRDAQRSSAHQQNHNLLLSDDAGVHTKPHLEIDADDVSCSHGATIGSLSDESRFYLRTRGIGPEQAEAILTYAFARDIIDGISHAPLRQRLAAALLDRLPHGDTIRELASQELS